MVVVGGAQDVGDVVGGLRYLAGLAGQIVERTEALARVTLLYDILKAEALAPRASIDLVRKAIETWT